MQRLHYLDLTRLHPQTQLTPQLPRAFPSFLSCSHSTPFLPRHALFPLPGGIPPTLECLVKALLLWGTPPGHGELSFLIECLYQVFATVLGSER